MQCREVMSRVPVFLHSEQSIAEVAEVMRDEDVGFLPVCGPDRKIVGAITDRDLVVRVLAPRRSLETPVRDVMSAEVVTCGQDDELQRAEQLMEAHQVARVMCVDADGALVGILGVADLARRDPPHVQQVVNQVKAEASPASH